jgi:hypothetical protein
MNTYTIGREGAASKSNGGVFKIKKAGGSLHADGGGDDGSVIWEVVEACSNNTIPPELLEWQPGRENAVALGASLAARLSAMAASGGDIEGEVTSLPAAAAGTTKTKKVRIEAGATGGA